MKKNLTYYFVFCITLVAVAAFCTSPLAAQDTLQQQTVIYNTAHAGSGNTVQVQSPNSFFPNIRIPSGSQLSAQQNETSIAIDPLNSQKAICSSNNFSCNGITYFYTTDGGSTWGNNCISVPELNQFGWNQPFDPSVTYDSRGNAYICCGQYRSISQGTAQNCIVVAKSTDGGINFAQAVVVYGDTLNVLAGSSGQQPFEDKMFLGCDASPSSPYRDRLYVSWTHFANFQPSVIYFSYSTDQGATWSAPGGNGISGNSPGPQGSVPVTGPDGTVYVTWSGGGFGQTATLQLARSVNGGQSFFAPQVVESVAGVGKYDNSLGRMELPDKDSMRIATFPTLAVDNSNSARRGHLYMAWQGVSQTDNSDHIFFSTSANNGQSWSDPTIIDNNQIGTDVFMPAIACDPTNGNISIDYYDSRNDINNHKIDLYCSLSNDGGASFKEFRISDTTTPVYTLPQGNSGGLYFGDYQGIAAGGGTTLPCWWDLRDGASYFSCHIFTAIVRSSANPATSLQASTTCGSNSVTLTWTDPTTTTLGDPIGSYTIIVYRGGDSLTTLPQGTTTYTDQTVVSGTTYFYSVVIASSAGNSAAISTQITAGGALATNPVSSFTLHPVAGGIRADWVNPTEHVDGTAACDLHAIYIYSDSGTVLDSIVTSTAGGSGSVTIPLDTTKVWQLYAQAVALRGSVYTMGDTSAHFTSYAGAPRQHLTENFDPPVPTFYTTGTWGITDSASESSPNSMTDSPNGNYATNRTTFCQLPPFSRNATDTTLTFSHILFTGIQSKADVDISTDNGVTWNIVREYTQANHAAQWQTNVHSSQWVQERIDITPYCKLGDTVSIRFRLTAGFQSRDGWYVDDVNIDSTLPNYVRIPNETPTELMLVQNYPNPFNASTSIQFMLPASGMAHLDVYNSLGQKVQTLVNGYLNAGSYSADFGGANLQPGVYFYTLRVGTFSSTKQMVLMK